MFRFMEKEMTSKNNNKIENNNEIERNNELNN